MTASKKQRKSGRVALNRPTCILEDAPDSLTDLYAAVTNPLACCRVEDHHKKKKNCVNNPWCLIDLHDEKKGIWKAKPLCMSMLGNDPAVMERKVQGDLHKLTPSGIKNLGATCYLNVLIQMLFHNLLVRDAVFNIQLDQSDDRVMNSMENIVIDKVEAKNEKDSHMNMVIGALQDTFGHLDSCVKGDYDISLFVDLLELNKCEQQDPQEFSKLFFAKMDESRLPVRDPSLPNIKQLISGKETYSTTCLKCGAVSSRSNEFHEIGLNIEGCSDLQTALDGYQALETLDGENQFSCSGCNKKTDATRGVKITETPDLLIFKLMRYYYDRKTNEKKKSQVWLLECICHVIEQYIFDIIL